MAQHLGIGKVTLAIGVISAVLSHVLVIDASCAGYVSRYLQWLGSNVGIVLVAFLILVSGLAMIILAVTGPRRYYLVPLSLSALSTLIAFIVNCLKNRNRSGFSVDFFATAALLLWIGVLLLVVIASLVGAIRHSRRRRKKKLFLCQNCGYSLKRLTVARCPECGTLFAPELLRQVGTYNDLLESFQRNVNCNRK